MKKTILSLLLALFTSFSAFAMDVSITHAAFKGEEEHYIEFYFYFVASTLTQIQVDSINSQGSVEVTTLLKQNGKIVKLEKFNLKSPLAMTSPNFLEMRRYAMDNGVYDVEIQLKDNNKLTNVATYKSIVQVDFPTDLLRQSDITLLSRYQADSSDNKYVKNGYFLEPLPFQYYDRNFANLLFYNELYNTDKSIKEDFLLSYSIENTEGVANKKAVIIGHKRKKMGNVIPNLVSMDISKLESGNYRLVVTVRNRNNDLLSQKDVYFQRNNPFLNAVLDSIPTDALDKEFVGKLDPKALRFALKSIAMNVTEEETSTLNTIIMKGDSMAERRFLFSFFARKNPNMPEQAYEEYMMVARAADRLYKNGFGYGFESDRGRIYMRHGQPSDVVSVENEMNAPPYEVWVYNTIEKTKQTNVKFLFYNPNLVANGYLLLHSTCRGEVNNPRWKRELYKSVPNELIGNNVDGTEVQNNYNRRAEQVFNDN